MINDALNNRLMDQRDRAFFVRLVHGSLEYQIQSDYIINQFSKVAVDKMKPLIRNVLRMSVYQIMHMDKIPDSAACSEAVNLVKKTSFRNLAGFVNGVLRTISREKDRIDLSERGVKYSVRPWMLGLLDDTIGADNTDAFLAYSLSDHKTSVRACGKLIEPQYFDPSGIYDDMYFVKDIASLTSLRDWREGRIIVQDISSSLPVRMAQLRENDIVFDVCAAPGGKAVQAAQMLNGTGHVYAFDISEKKIGLINENIQRLGLRNISAEVRDASVFYPELSRKADVVIADLPCSGIGTIAHKPDIKNRLTPEDCIGLAGLQKKILENVKKYVKPGGKLVYSTCTLDHFENQDNLRAPLNMQILPGAVPQDGFYITVLEV